MTVKAYIDIDCISKQELTLMLKTCLPLMTDDSTPLKITGTELSNYLHVSLRTVRTKIKYCITNLTNEMTIETKRGRNGYYLISFNSPYIKLYDGPQEVEHITKSKPKEAKRAHRATGNPVGRPKADVEYLYQVPPIMIHRHLERLKKQDKDIWTHYKYISAGLPLTGQYMLWRPSSKDIYRPDLDKEKTMNKTDQKRAEKLRNRRLNSEISISGLHWKHFLESSDPEGNLEAYLLMIAYSTYKNLLEFDIDNKTLMLRTLDNEKAGNDPLTDLNVDKLFNFHKFVKEGSKVFGTSWLGSFSKFAETMRNIGIKPIAGLSYFFERKDFYLNNSDYKINIESPNQLYTEKSLEIIKQGATFNSENLGKLNIWNPKGNIILNVVSALLNQLINNSLSEIEHNIRLSTDTISDTISAWAESTSDSYDKVLQKPSIMLATKKQAIWFNNELKEIDNNDNIKDKAVAKKYLATVLHGQQEGLSLGLPVLNTLAVPTVRKALRASDLEIKAQKNEIVESLATSGETFDTATGLTDVYGSETLIPLLFGHQKIEAQLLQGTEGSYNEVCSTFAVRRYTKTFGIDYLFILGQLLDEALDLYPDDFSLVDCGIDNSLLSEHNMLDLSKITEGIETSTPVSILHIAHTLEGKKEPKLNTSDDFITQLIASHPFSENA